MLCILCILLAVYFALSSWNSRQKEEERAQEESEVIHVTDADAADIVSFSYDMGSGLLSFEKRDGQWYYTEDEDFPLDQSVPEQITVLMKRHGLQWRRCTQRMKKKRRLHFISETKTRMETGML